MIGGARKNKEETKVHKNAAFAPFVIPNKSSDEQFPYHARINPGGGVAHGYNPKTISKIPQSHQKQYFGEKKGKRINSKLKYNYFIFDTASSNKPYSNQLPVKIPKEVKEEKKRRNSFKSKQ